jgi:dihydrofolate reductase
VRKITANLYMTLDGYGEFPKYPGSDVVTEEPDSLFQDMWIDRYDAVDTVVFGRRSFEGHLAVHSLRGRKPTDPKFLFDYSRFLERTQKIVLSHKLKTTDWANTRFMRGDLARVIARLRREPGKDIIVDGGPALIRELMQRGLADDYRIGMWPVVLGRGHAYWGRMRKQRTLKLLSVKTLPYGELLLHYETVR